MKLDTMLVLGYLLLVGVIFIGVAHGSPQELWSPEALVVAFGGAMVATFAGLSMQELREAAQAGSAFVSSEVQWGQRVALMDTVIVQ